MVVELCRGGGGAGSGKTLLWCDSVEGAGGWGAALRALQSARWRAVNILHRHRNLFTLHIYCCKYIYSGMKPQIRVLTTAVKEMLIKKNKKNHMPKAQCGGHRRPVTTNS